MYVLTIYRDPRTYKDRESPLILIPPSLLRHFEHQYSRLLTSLRFSLSIPKANDKLPTHSHVQHTNIPGFLLFMETAPPMGPTVCSHFVRWGPMIKLTCTTWSLSPKQQSQCDRRGGCDDYGWWRIQRAEDVNNSLEVGPQGHEPYILWSTHQQLEVRSLKSLTSTTTRVNDGTAPALMHSASYQTMHLRVQFIAEMTPPTSLWK